jgi:hypothetical protein
MPEPHDRYDTVETPAYQLCNVLCGQYAFTSDAGKVQSRELIQALVRYFEYDPLFVDVLRGMYTDALEATRLGRGNAEVENWHREVLARQSTKED